MSTSLGLFDEVAHNWRERLDLIVETMKEMSRQTDPQEMSRAYGQRMQTLRPIDRRVSLSRRGLKYPWYRVTRCTLWKEDINPWKEPHRLPLLKGGLFAELLYGDEPRLFEDVQTARRRPRRRVCGRHVVDGGHSHVRSGRLPQHGRDDAPRRRRHFLRNSSRKSSG